MFVNRTGELAALDRWWVDGRRPGLVWGRRRVGKTALLQRFAADHRTVWHTGAGRPAVGELAVLARAVASAAPVGIRDLGRRPSADWDDALEDLAARAEDEPLLLVLDELPELIAAAPELPGVLRAFLDRAEGRTGLRILVCGSAVRTMAALQEERAPLYGRFDLSLLLHPFRPHEAALLLPDLVPAERALVHGLLGGMPLYLSWWDQAADVPANLERLACRPGAPLLQESQLVLATEVEAGALPGAALQAIASGRTRYGEIKAVLRAEPARTLERLEELRLVERRSPVTEGRRSRKVTYRVADPFLSFSLGVLGRYRSEIERGLGAAILPSLVASLGDHLGGQWEAAVVDHLRLLAGRGDLGEGVVAIGSWWNDASGIEIDAVVLAGRSRRPVLVAEAKWAREVDARRLSERLRRRSAAVPGADPEQIALVVAAREHLRDLPADVRGLTAEDVYG